MTSAFPRVPSAAAGAPPRRRGPWGSTPFRVALVAGLLAAAVSWGGGQYLVESQYREESKEIGTALQPLGRGLADALVAPLDRGDLLAGMRQMRVALERLPEADAVLLDADGAVLLGPMTSSELPALDAVKDLNNPGLSRGRHGDIRVVQWQGPVHGRTDALGMLILRLPVPGPGCAASPVPAACSPAPRRATTANAPPWSAAGR
jgi:hypothetical protein